MLIRHFAPLVLAASFGSGGCTKNRTTPSEPLTVEGGYTSEELSVASDAPPPIGRCNLGTTVLIPNGPPPRATVVIIHGSGPSDRDLTLPGGYHPYRDIAVYLAEHGYATVRFDKRSAIKECAQKLGETLGVDVFLRDVQAVTQAAQKLPRLSQAPLVLFGHSEGVTYANEIAARKLLDPKGLILVAGLGRYPIDATFLRQLRSELQRPDLNAAQRAGLEKLIDEGSTYFMKIRSDEAKPGDFFVGAFTRFWTESIQVTENAASTARATTQPALLLQGDQDENVTRDDFEALRTAFASRPLTTALILPNVTHLMTPVGETTVSPELMARMDTWLQRLTAPAARGHD